MKQAPSNKQQTEASLSPDSPHQVGAHTPLDFFTPSPTHYPSSPSHPQTETNETCLTIEETEHANTLTFKDLWNIFNTDSRVNRHIDSLQRIYNTQRPDHPLISPAETVLLASIRQCLGIHPIRQYHLIRAFKANRTLHRILNDTRGKRHISEDELELDLELKLE